MNFKIDEIRRSNRRKSIAIKFIDDKIVVYAPWGVTDKQIYEILKKHREKIERKIEEQKKRKVPKLKFITGEKILYFGKEYPIKKVDAKEEFIRFTGFSFEFFADSIQKSKLLFENYFRQSAKYYICKRAFELAKKFGFSFENCKITKAKTRWGSCSIKNNINFSLYLIMAPKELIDYVIIHELAHTIEKNHSKKFWYIVQKNIPNYKIYKNWFKKNGHKYRF